MNKSSSSGCGTGILLCLVGILAIPVGLSLPQETLGIVLGALIGLIALIPVLAIVVMALQTRQRDAERRIQVRAAHEIERIQVEAEEMVRTTQPRQWVLVDQNWAASPQQNAYRNGMVTIDAVRRDRSTAQPGGYDDTFYYEDADQEVVVEETPPVQKRRSAPAGKKARPVTAEVVVQPAARALVPAKPQQERSFTLTGYARRTDVFRVVGE